MSKPKPFLRWVGGKEWLSPLIKALGGIQDYSEYREPFLGSGAIFFQMSPLCASLSDSNETLISAFQAIANNPDEVFHRLSKLPADEFNYYRLRSSKPRSQLGMVIKFIYLNRLSYGGIYRVNSRGEFNVPYGGKVSLGEAVGVEQLRLISKSLENTSIFHSDFRASLTNSKNNSFVYLDPVFTGTSKERFDRYNQNRFSISDHGDLSDLVSENRFKKNCLSVVSLPYDFEFSKFYNDGIWVAVRRCDRFGLRRDRKIGYLELLWLGIREGDSKKIERILGSFRYGRSVRVLGYSGRRLTRSVMAKWQERAEIHES